MMPGLVCMITSTQLDGSKIPIFVWEKAGQWGVRRQQEHEQIIVDYVEHMLKKLYSWLFKECYEHTPGVIFRRYPGLKREWGKSPFSGAPPTMGGKDEDLYDHWADAMRYTMGGMRGGKNYERAKSKAKMNQYRKAYGGRDDCDCDNCDYCEYCDSVSKKPKSKIHRPSREDEARYGRPEEHIKSHTEYIKEFMDEFQDINIDPEILRGVYPGIWKIFGSEANGMGGISNGEGL
jgi:hypothetical protein